MATGNVSFAHLSGYVPRQSINQLFFHIERIVLGRLPEFVNVFDSIFNGKSPFRIAVIAATIYKLFVILAPDVLIAVIEIQIANFQNGVIACNAYVYFLFRAHPLPLSRQKVQYGACPYFFWYSTGVKYESGYWQCLCCNPFRSIVYLWPLRIGFLHFLQKRIGVTSGLAHIGHRFNPATPCTMHTNILRVGHLPHRSFHDSRRGTGYTAEA